MEVAVQERERQDILRSYRKLIEAWYTRKDTRDRWMVRKAFRLAADAHKDMRRKTGEPFILHPIAVATIAAGEIGLGRTSIIAALLHDTVEDTEITLTDIRIMFGEEVERIIDGLTKIDEISDNTSTAQAETLKKILYTLSDDVRVILVKLADRLHNMRTLEAMPKVKQLKIASETLYIYAPLAYRLGLFAIKSELEELSFKYNQPQVYKDIKGKMSAKAAEQLKSMENFIEPIDKALKEKQNAAFNIRYNEKTTYAIWQKMRANQIPFEEVHDTFSIDVIIDTEPEKEKLACWGAYTVITSLYKPNNKRLHDWISTPKANGYEAIHTTVMGKNGKWFDVHIRSKRMDEIAQRGYAAYWKYKDVDSVEAGLDGWLSKTRELLTESDEEAIAFINDFKQNLFSEEIVVFTPDGEMINLPAEATVLDFAYAIHTDLGNHCIGANVNHRLVPVDYHIKSGDQVEVITSRIQQPNENWFEYVVTARAKSRIKLAIKNERKSFRKEGEEKLSGYLGQLKLEPTKPNISKLIADNNLKGPVDLYYYIAQDRIGLKEVKESLQPQQDSLVSWMKSLRFPFVRTRIPSPGTISLKDEKENGTDKTSETLTEDFSELDYIVANCCNPIPGDEVIGLVFPNEPIQIHKTECETAIKLMSQYGKNIIKARWKHKEGIAFMAGLQIRAVDKIGFIKQLGTAISDDFKMNIRSLNMESKAGLINLTMTLYVSDTESLKQLISHLKKTKGVIKVSRLDRFQ